MKKSTTSSLLFGNWCQTRNETRIKVSYPTGSRGLQQRRPIPILLKDNQTRRVFFCCPLCAYASNRRDKFDKHFELVHVMKKPPCNSRRKYSYCMDNNEKVDTCQKTNPSKVRPQNQSQRTATSHTHPHTFFLLTGGTCVTTM